jgi:hypothetical protein
VLSSSFDYSSAAHRITLHFSRDVSASLVNVHGLITDLSTGQLIPDGQISFAYDHTNNTAAITFPALSQGRLPDGRYRLTLKSDAIADSSGIKLDGDSDGAAGGDYTFDFFELRGDVDRDQTVGFSDLVAVAQNYGKSDRTLAQGDVDGDGTVGFADLVAIAQNYGKSLVSAPIAAAAAVAAVAQSAPATARPPVKPASLTARSAAMPMLVSPFSTRRIEPARKTDTLY